MSIFEKLFCVLLSAVTCGKVKKRSLSVFEKGFIYPLSVQSYTHFLNPVTVRLRTTTTIMTMKLELDINYNLSVSARQN